MSQPQKPITHAELTAAIDAVSAVFFEMLDDRDDRIAALERSHTVLRDRLNSLDQAISEKIRVRRPRS